MKKTFVYKNLLAFAVVIALLLTAGATVLTTYAYSDTSRVNVSFFWGYNNNGTLKSTSSDSTIDESQLAADTKVYLGTTTTGSAITQTTISTAKTTVILERTASRERFLFLLK